METKVIYEVRLSKPVMTVAVMAAVGLLAIGAKPLIEATPAFAVNQFDVQKIAICSWDGTKCVSPVKNGKFLRVPISALPGTDKYQVEVSGTTK